MRLELTGGGLVRSYGGWGTLKSLSQTRIHLKGGERILGDSDFVETVLARHNEQMEKRYRLQVLGYDFDKVVDQVVKIFEIKPEHILIPSKQLQRVKARSLVCYWAVKELGMSGTAVATLLGITQTGVSKAMQRGKKLTIDKNYI